MGWLELNLEKPAETTETDFLLTTTKTILQYITNHFSITTWYFRWTNKPYATTLQFRFKTQAKEQQKIKKHLNTKLTNKFAKYSINEYPNNLPNEQKPNTKMTRNFYKMLHLTSQTTIELTQNNNPANPIQPNQDPLIFIQKLTSLTLNQIQPLLIQTNQTNTTDFYLQQAIAHHATKLLKTANPNLPTQTIQDAIGQIQEKTIDETKNNIQQKLNNLIQNCQ